MAVQMMFKAFLGKSRRHYLPFAKCNHFSSKQSLAFR
jgi:hypothetical protein